MEKQNEISEIISRFFSADNLNRLAWFGESETTAEVYRYLRNNGKINKQPTLRQLSEEVFKVLEERYRIEYVFKTYILKKTIFGRNSPNTTSLYFEFPIARGRADVLLVNGKAMVFEIKTRYDDYALLEDQINEYYQCFPEVTVLVDPLIVDAVAGKLPPYVGVSTLSNSFTVSRIRNPISNTRALDHGALFSILRDAERRYVLVSNGYEIPDVHPADIYEECAVLFGLIPLNKAYTFIVESLRARQSTNKLADLCAHLPRSLHAAVFSYRMRKKDWATIVSSIDRLVKVS